jgi:hypothetical protein
MSSPNTTQVTKTKRDRLGMFAAQIDKIELRAKKIEKEGSRDCGS